MATAVAAREDRTTVGVLIMAVGVLFLTMIDTSAKWLALAGLPVIQIVFMRYAVHFAMSLAVTLPKYGTSILYSQAPLEQALRSLLLLVAQCFWSLHWANCRSR